MQESRNLEYLVTAAAYFGDPPSDPVEGLERAHRIQTMLCDLLEQIADSIPGGVDHGLCAQLASELGPVLKNIHCCEETSLFPLIENSQADTSQTASTVERLKHEHFDEECFAEELTEALRKLSRRKEPKNPDALGCMLRGFFEAMRRHVAFERNICGSLSANRGGKPQILARAASRSRLGRSHADCFRP